ncbi:uncharacterized protein FYW61_014320 [Anableps anableps]
MLQDIKEFIKACRVCCQAKPSRRPPSGLLRPLPVPHHPWSHISMDFVTGLPSSITILSSQSWIDFSKMSHLIPLCKLPLSKELGAVLARFTISKVINPVAVQLRLPRTLRVCPTFHVSRVKPVFSSQLVPSSRPPLPARIIDGGGPLTWCTTSFAPDVGVGPSITWWIGRDMGLKSAPGCRPGTFWINPLSGSFIGPILTSQVVLLEPDLEEVVLS